MGKREGERAVEILSLFTSFSCSRARERSSDDEFKSEAKEQIQFAAFGKFVPIRDEFGRPR